LQNFPRGYVSRQVSTSARQIAFGFTTKLDNFLVAAIARWSPELNSDEAQAFWPAKL
jgi:hypothetical protein